MSRRIILTMTTPGDMDALDRSIVGIPTLVDPQKFLEAVWPVPDPKFAYTIILQIDDLPKPESLN